MKALCPTTRRIARILVAAICTCTGVTAVAAAPASAQSVTYKTNLFMSEAFPAFHGKVHSQNGFCEADRRVKLFKQRFGPDKMLGKDRTTPNGHWKVKVENLSSGVYYAKAPAYGSASLEIQCKADMSRIAAVD